LLEHLKNSYIESLKYLNEFCNNEENFKITEAISRDIATAFKNGKKVLICGNGGSNCDAQHFAEEFTGRFRDERPALPAIAISDSSHITCVGNDYGFDYIFSKGVEAFGQEGDVLIGLSTSGNSKNVIKALEVAKDRKMTTIGLLGKEGGAIKGTTDYEFIIPAKTSDRVQEIHMIILHIIIEGVERIMFPENY